MASKDDDKDAPKITLPPREIEREIEREIFRRREREIEREIFREMDLGRLTYKERLSREEEEERRLREEEERRRREEEERSIKEVGQQTRAPDTALANAQERVTQQERRCTELEAEKGELEGRVRELEERVESEVARRQQIIQQPSGTEARLRQAHREMEERARAAETRLGQAQEGQREAERQRVESEHRFSQKERRCAELATEKGELEGRMRELEERVEDEVARREQATQRTSTAETRLRQAEQRLRESEERTNTAEIRMRQSEQRSSTRISQAEQRLREAEERMREAEERYREAEERLGVAERSHREKEQRNLQVMQHQIWMIEREEIQFSNQELGRGAWAAVKVGKFRGIQVAAKCMHGIIISDYNHELFVREMNFAAKLRHPNLVQFLGATLEGEPVILTELMTTTLRGVLEQQHLKRDHVFPICQDIAKALNYLHLTRPDPIIHRDVSSANVLLNPGPNDSWLAKLSDYGTANFARQVMTAGPGNPSYAAPEAGNPSQQSPKMDVYSYGVLLVEIATQRFPDKKTLAQQIRGIKIPRLPAIIRSCIQDNPSRRPTMSHLLTQL